MKVCYDLFNIHRNHITYITAIMLTDLMHFGYLLWLKEHCYGLYFVNSTAMGNYMSKAHP